MVDKVTLPNFVEIRHSVPAQIDPPMQEEVASVVTAFLNAVGIQEGPTHTELKLTPKGPRIVESHNRVGGGRITRLVEIVYDVDMVSLTYAWATGLVTPLSDSPQPTKGAVTRFFDIPAGIVQEIQGLEEIRNREEVVELSLDLKVGDLVTPIYQSQDRPGYLVLKGKSVCEAIETSEQLARKLFVVIE